MISTLLSVRSGWFASARGPPGVGTAAAAAPPSSIIVIGPPNPAPDGVAALPAAPKSIFRLGNGSLVALPVPAAGVEPLLEGSAASSRGGIRSLIGAIVVGVSRSCSLAL